MYVERPAKLFARRHITVFSDDSKSRPLIYVNQDRYWEITHKNFTVSASDGEPIANLSRNNFVSLFRRGWTVKDTSGKVIAKAREDSVLLATVRRVLQLIPLIQLIGALIKTDFHLLALDTAGNERKIGAFIRRLTIADRYLLDLSDDPGRHLDRRIAVGLGILLDSGERR